MPVVLTFVFTVPDPAAFDAAEVKNAVRRLLREGAVIQPVPDVSVSQLGEQAAGQTDVKIEVRTGQTSVSLTTVDRSERAAKDAMRQSVGGLFRKTDFGGGTIRSA